MFKVSGIAIIKKIDLEDVMEVNIEEMIKNAKFIKLDLKLFTTSVLTGVNISELIKEILN